MKNALIILVALVLLAIARADEPKSVSLHFSKADIRELLVVYERLTNARVFIALDLQALITIETDGPIPIPTAIELIRTILVQRYGIELRATGHGETLAAWSTDPKYPHSSDPPMTQAERDALPKGRIRVIK